MNERTDTRNPAPRAGRVYHHGQTPAAWTGMGLAMIGFILAALGAMMGPAWWLCWLGGGLVLAGVVAGWALTLAGLGEAHHRH